MELTQLELRTTPSVAFDLDATVPAAYRDAIETAGRSVFNRVAGDFRIPVRTDPTLNSLAVGSPQLGVVLNPNVNWHLGTTTLGLGAMQFDMVSVVGHELFHALGYLTHLGVFFTDLVNRYSIDPILTAVIAPGTRYTPTELDFDALRGLGYTITPRSYPEFYILSSSGADGLARQYLVFGSQVLFLGVTGRDHVTVSDLNYDGALDLLVTPRGYGVGVGVDGRTWQVTVAAVYFGPSVTLTRY
jgi:hypothetical protein